MDLREAAQSPLFNNAHIQRRLSDEALKAVFTELEVKGNVEWLDKAQTRCNVYWRSPEEWGALIYAHVKSKGQTNAVCTFYELTEGPEAVGQAFFGLDENLLIKSLKTLELQKKAEVFNNEGVKFF